MTAILLSIGDELVLGQTVDTNSAWLSQQLAAVGCDIASHITVGDDQRGIETAVLESVGRCDVIVITGGLGPTADDLTRQALATVARAELRTNDEWLVEMRKYFEKLGRVMPQSNAIQAKIPVGSKMIWNTCGTAAGIDLPYQSGDNKTNCRIFAMPGVPKEMKAMFTLDVLPWISQHSGGAAIVSRTVHTFSLGESMVAEKLGDLMMRQRNPSVGTTVSGGVVSLRINARYPSVDDATREADATVAACREKLGGVVYGEGTDTLVSVVTRLLREQGKTVATAESCTGGLLAKMLTDLPGSSAYFKRGWVTYANEAKFEDLSVDAALISQHGAVSEPAACAMAEGALARAGTDFALAITGVAGPDGGTDAKPVGTVVIALVDRIGRYTSVKTHRFTGDREMIRDRSAKMALWLLRGAVSNA